MNIICFLIEILIVYGLMILFYHLGKKDGLFHYISLISSILSFVVFKTVSIFSFEINLGLTIIVGIFTACNIIIQRYGLDEIKRIILSFVIPFVGTAVIVSLLTLANCCTFDLSSIDAYDLLFGYNLDNVRYFVSCLVSVSFMLWLDGEIYYTIRKSKNNLILSNVGTTLIIQFIESLIFIFIAYMGVYDFLEIIGMICIRYILKVLMSGVSIAPIYLLVKKDK